MGLHLDTSLAPHNFGRVKTVTARTFGVEHQCLRQRYAIIAEAATIKVLGGAGMAHQ
jgi:hypothetical protein